MLEVRDLETAYGRSQVLFGIASTCRRGEVVTLLGRNGMGKTTTVRSIMGITPPQRGHHSVRGQADRAACLPTASPRPASAWCPRAGRCFPTSPCARTWSPRARQGPWTLERVYELFPHLEARKGNYGNQLSGGEQQMLAIGRALMTNPRLLILDEATEGLAPLIRAEIYRSIERLKAEGLSILVIDKDVKALTRVADRHYVLEKGRVVWSGTQQRARSERGSPAPLPRGLDRRMRTISMNAQ